MLVKRNMDEMITHFNDVVSAMDISIKDKMTILGMITAIGYEYQEAADAIEEQQRILDVYGGEDGIVAIFKERDELLKRVPAKPHGRLIDADALMKEMNKQENAMFEHGREFTFSFKSGGDVCTAWYNVEMMVEDAPTIIPASEEGE